MTKAKALATSLLSSTAGMILLGIAVGLELLPRRLEARHGARLLVDVRRQFLYFWLEFGRLALNNSQAIDLHRAFCKLSSP